MKTYVIRLTNNERERVQASHWRIMGGGALVFDLPDGKYRGFSLANIVGWEEVDG